MALRLIYLVICRLVSWTVLLARSDTTKDVEILVPRHQPPYSDAALHGHG